MSDSVKPARAAEPGWTALVLPIQGIIVSLLIALVVSQFAALWLARRVADIHIIEAIQFE